MINKLVKFIKKNLYTNETVILFEYYKAMYVPPSPAIVIKHVDPNNVTDILDFQPNRYVKIFQNFMRLGDKGYFGYLDGKCVHRSWVKSNEQRVSLHLAKQYQLRKDEHFIHYCETVPQARGKGIYPRVLAKIITEYKNKGMILISANATNYASIKGIKRAGFRESKREQILIIIGIRIHR